MADGSPSNAPVLHRARALRAGLWAAASLLALTSPGRAASPVPVGPEFQVPVVTAGDQFLPAIHFNSLGEFAVTWTDSTNIKARVYDASGAARTSELLCNTTVIGNQNESQIAISDSGRFVVCWTDYNGADGEALGVLAQQFARGGTRIGPEFIVNEVTQGSQWEAMVDYAADDSFVCVWVDSIPGDGSNAGIFGRIFDRDGTPRTGQFQVNDFIVAAQINPSLVVCPDGSFVVAWQDRSGQDGSLSRIMARRFDPEGNPLFPDRQVNVTFAGDQTHPSVVARPDGSFTVVYTDRGGGDGDGWGVFFRSFDAQGNPASPELRANETTAGSQGLGEAGWDDGLSTLFIAWTDFDGLDGSGDGIFARAFDLDGTPAGPEFRVNTLTAGNQTDADVRMSTTGAIAVVWEDQSGADGDGKGIFGQRFQTATAVPAGNPWILFAALLLAASVLLARRRRRRA